MAASAFAPAHLTGFFKIYANTSAGAGLTLQSGMLTSVRTSRSAKTKIFINNTDSSAIVSKWVLSKFSPYLDEVPIEIHHRTPLPIGCGLGMSAAGALSLSLALNEWCSRPFNYKECVSLAHDADVACGTGLASVDAMAIGGMVSRKGATGKPAVHRFSPSELLTPVSLAVFGPMKTSSVIRSKNWKQRVNSAGASALSAFYKKRTLANLAVCSNSFAIRSGLGKWAHSALSENPSVGMAMLGKTIFAVGGHFRHAALQEKLGEMKIVNTYPTNRPACVV